MTKLRPPLSTENALDLIIGALTIEGAAKAADRKVSYLRALSDPDKDQKLTVDDAIALDLAYLAAGHAGTPLFDSIGLRLRTAESLDLTGAAILNDHAIDVTKEGSEAIVALLTASTPTPDPVALRSALKELVESHRAHEAAIRTVRCMLERHGQGADPPT